MAQACNNCKEQTISVPYVVHESAMARAERQLKRLWGLIILLVVLLVGTNIAWLIYESQFETVETKEEYHIEQDAENGNNNSIINGGEIVNGETDDNIQKKQLKRARRNSVLVARAVESSSKVVQLESNQDRFTQRNRKN